MRGSVGRYVLADSGFWLALYDERDAHHRDALAADELICEYYLVIPWPTLYEVLCTRFTRKRDWLVSFDRACCEPGIQHVPDAPYRESALRRVLKSGSANVSRRSLVDEVIREMLRDTKLRIHYLLTFNSQDFRDVCTKRGIEMLDG